MSPISRLLKPLPPMLWSLFSILVLVNDVAIAAADDWTMKTFTYKTLPGGEHLELDTHRRAGDEVRPVIMFIHGGALMMGGRKMTASPGSLFAAMLDAGYVVVSIDYRLAPQVKLPTIIEDVKDAYDWVRKEGPASIHIDASQIFIMGQSAGGYLTQMTGFCVHPRPRGLVSFLGYGDIAGGWYSKTDSFYRQQTL